MSQLKFYNPNLHNNATSDRIGFTTKTRLESLGVHISCDGSTDLVNHVKVKEKVLKVCTNWCNHNLTLHGKIIMVNILMVSRFVYKMIVVVNLMNQQMKEIEAILVDYIWKSKKLTIFITAHSAIFSDRWRFKGS